jgi:hypothetical protein
MVGTINKFLTILTNINQNFPFFFPTKPFANYFVPNIAHRQGINKVNGSSHHLHLS